jgi:GTP pyrophosphokinase
MHEQLKLAKTYIAEHLTDELSLGEIAGAVGYSEYHFARMFKAELGESVMEYVTRRRLDAAKTDLAGGQKVIDTAMKYGFDTHAGFTKAFAAEFGCAPIDYAAHRPIRKETSKWTIIQNWIILCLQ